MCNILKIFVMLTCVMASGTSVLATATYSVPSSELGTDASTAVLLHFNENAGYPSGTTAMDSSVNGNNGVAVGSVGYNASWPKFGASAGLIPTWDNGSYFRIADNASLDVPQISVEAMFVCNNSINTNDWMTIVARNAGSANGGFGIYMDPLGDGIGGNQYATIWAEIAGVDLNRTGGTGLHTVIQNDVAYHHVALTFSNGIARLYLDGNLEDEKTSTYSLLPASTSNITVGGGGGGAIGWFGRIDEVRISSIDRSIIPEPCTLVLLGGGMLITALRKRNIR
ncbi:MAG: LamG-like jellyroll fold domain-containing protein [Sedimentisphaerales bacterium]